MSHNHYLLIIGVHLHANPVTWKGDPIGHIGARDAFFYVAKGECYVRIENESFIIKNLLLHIFLAHTRSILPIV